MASSPQPVDVSDIHEYLIHRIKIEVCVLNVTTWTWCWNITTTPSKEPTR